jgi:hypothetical protein
VETQALLPPNHADANGGERSGLALAASAVEPTTVTTEHSRARTQAGTQASATNEDRRGRRGRAAKQFNPAEWGDGRGAWHESAGLPARLRSVACTRAVSLLAAGHEAVSTVCNARAPLLRRSSKARITCTVRQGR